MSDAMLEEIKTLMFRCNHYLFHAIFMFNIVRWPESQMLKHLEMSMLEML